MTSPKNKKRAGWLSTFSGKGFCLISFLSSVISDTAVLDVSMVLSGTETLRCKVNADLLAFFITKNNPTKKDEIINVVINIFLLKLFIWFNFIMCGDNGKDLYKIKSPELVISNPRLCFFLILNGIKCLKIKLPGDDDTEDIIRARAKLAADT